MNSRKQCTGSCGCLRRETTVARSTTHGLSHTPEYRVWTTMINRCTNPNYAEFHLYGGRGITVAKPWRKFEKFFNDMGPRPSPKHQLDRERNSEGYSADNCRWVTAKLNGRNKKNTVTVTLHGIQITLADLAEKAGIDYHAAFYRYQQGWSAERIFNTPSRKAKGAL
jgi:hypothetical protein